MAGEPEAMSIPNAEFIERCQIEYSQNPKSRVFATLAEAYRKMGLIDEGLEIAERGVRQHPDFAAGRIAYARLLITEKKNAKAYEQLKKASELSPDNLLAFQLLGETLLELRRPKEALSAFKMVLFLNPLHERAQKMVRKWEFLTADDFSEEEFQWTPSETDLVPEVESSLEQNALDPTRADREAYRTISIADALTVRNDHEGAFAVLGRAMRILGPRADLQQRLHLLGRRIGLRPEEVERLAESSINSAQKKIRQEARKESSASAKKRKRLEGMLNRLARR